MAKGPGRRLATVKEDQFYDFLLTFFQVQSIIFNKIGVDELEDLVPQTLEFLAGYF